MTAPSNGQQYLAWLHEHRRRLWEKARQEGKTTAQIVRELQQSGQRVWDSFRRNRPSASREETES